MHDINQLVICNYLLHLMLIHLLINYRKHDKTQFSSLLWEVHVMWLTMPHLMQCLQALHWSISHVDAWGTCCMQLTSLFLMYFLKNLKWKKNNKLYPNLKFHSETKYDPNFKFCIEKSNFDKIKNKYLKR